MLGYYNYTVILTYLSLSSAVFGIYSSFTYDKGAMIAIWCLLFSGFCDMFDGAVARTKKRTKQEKAFGIQLDSLADLVCFGVLPTIIGYKLGLGDKWWYIIFMIVYTLCALIRLAYFNVTEEERQKVTNGKRKYYEGLPVTSAAMLFPFVFCFQSLFENPFDFAVLYTAVMGVTAVMFISPFKIKKPGKIGLAIFLLIGVAIVSFLTIKTIYLV
jgi:CDP-diacylglycerol--serine O-phosphatidyltransferase